MWVARLAARASKDPRPHTVWVSLVSWASGAGRNRWLRSWAVSVAPGERVVTCTPTPLELHMQRFSETEHIGFGSGILRPRTARPAKTGCRAATRSSPPRPRCARYCPNRCVRSRLSGHSGAGSPPQRLVIHEQKIAGKPLPRRWKFTRPMSRSWVASESCARASSVVRSSPTARYWMPKVRARSLPSASSAENRRANQDQVQSACCQLSARIPRQYLMRLRCIMAQGPSNVCVSRYFMTYLSNRCLPDPLSSSYS